MAKIVQHISAIAASLLFQCMHARSVCVIFMTSADHAECNCSFTVIVFAFDAIAAIPPGLLLPFPVALSAFFAECDCPAWFGVEREVIIDGIEAEDEKTFGDAEGAEIADEIGGSVAPIAGTVSTAAPSCSNKFHVVEVAAKKIRNFGEVDAKMS